MRRMVVLALIVYLTCSASALAHRVQVFATVEEGLIKGEATLSGGKNVINGKIKVLRQDDRTLLQSTTTGDNGRFVIDPKTLGIDRPADLLIVLDADPGHRSEWLVYASDYELSAGQPDLQAEQVPASPGAGAPLPATPPLKNIVSGVLCILGLGALIAWSRSRKRRKK